RRLIARSCSRAYGKCCTSTIYRNCDFRRIRRIPRAPAEPFDQASHSTYHERSAQAGQSVERVALQLIEEASTFSLAPTVGLFSGGPSPPDPCSRHVAKWRTRSFLFP